MIHQISLPGCRPLPLSAYLKGLGTVRLLAEQADREARCFWRQDQLVLQTSLDGKGIESFFLHQYEPSPVMAPWNGGSGFYPKDNDKALTAIEGSHSDRFKDYQACLAQARRELARFQLREKPSEETKRALLQRFRNVLSDNALEWLDAAFLLNQDRPKYPPLLGTGGNDGRLEFTNNFMQRLSEVFSVEDGTPSPKSSSWLKAALFDEAHFGLEKAPIGQFDPQGAGGANAGTGFDSDSLINPWDYILMIEGALLFAVASAKRLESIQQGQLAYPFCVRQAGVGYATESLADEQASRAEMWMPMWSRPTGLSELRTVLNEGRAQVSGRPARNGVDFARAVASLGVDRGLTEFQRYGFQVRNGLSYFATPLDRLPVRRNRYVRLLDDIDSWLDRFRSRAASQNPSPPAGIASALRRLENAIVRLCQTEERRRVQAVLCELGRCERALNRSLTWTREKAFLQPIQGLGEQWLQAADTGQPEFRLATALASSFLLAGKRRLPFRHFLEPVELRGNKENYWYAWRDEHLSETAWIESDPVNALNAIFKRQLIIAQNSPQKGDEDYYFVHRPHPTPLFDIAAFIDGNIDISHFGDLLWGLALIDWHNIDEPPTLRRGADDVKPDSLYALLKLCFAGAKVEEVAVPVIPAIHHRASHGYADEATQMAARRLRASGLAPAVASLPSPANHACRTAAALLFPISDRSIRVLAKQVLYRDEEKDEEPMLEMADEEGG